MSEAQNQSTPPVGEEIHLPGGSLQPVALSAGLTIAIVGATTSMILVVIGVVLSVVTLYAWIRDARREYDHLPADLGHDHPA